MTVDREQTRRDDVEAFTALVNDKHRCAPEVFYAWVNLRDALLAELEQAKRERDEARKWANTMEHERDWETQVVHSELLHRAESLAGVLRKTIYKPEGYSGPDVWWADEAREALAAYEQAQEQR